MHTITTVAFDYGGVLARKIGDEFLCHMAQTAGADPDRFIPALWRHRDRYDAGELDAPSYWRAVIEEAGPDGTSRRNGEDETVHLLMHLDALGWGSIQPAMVRWLSTLRAAGFRRMIISNMSEEMHAFLIEETPLRSYFDRVVISGVIGINKPDRRIFEAASEEIGAPLAEILFIDDLGHNVEGATAAGMQAIQFADPATFAGELGRRFPEIPVTGLVCP